MASSNRLTRAEEREFTDWLLAALESRPNNFHLDDGCWLVDSVTKIWVHIGKSDYGDVSVWKPAATGSFRWRNARRIQRAVVGFRHIARNAVWIELKLAMAKARHLRAVA